MKKINFVLKKRFQISGVIAVGVFLLLALIMTIAAIFFNMSPTQISDLGIILNTIIGNFALDLLKYVSGRRWIAVTMDKIRSFKRRFPDKRGKSGKKRRFSTKTGKKFD